MTLRHDLCDCGHPGFTHRPEGGRAPCDYEDCGCPDYAPRKR